MIAQNELEDTERIAAIGATFHTDKIEPQGYFTTYLKIAADLGPRANVCELGIWQGESLRMWQALFPLGQVTGVDYQAHDRAWPEGAKQVITMQDNPNLPELVGGPFDLIVDDASHQGTQTRRSFEMLWPLLSPGGYYVIEDWYMALRADGALLASVIDQEFLASVTDLTRLITLDSDCDFVHFKWGMAIAHKRKINE